MSAEVQSELLFFDTFSHDSSEDLNLDLVQFPRPVLVHEVRVIPLGTRVQADVPGGVRLGATNPSSFTLEFLVNNLKRPEAAIFEKLGVLEYKANDTIQLTTDGQIPTDGLILKGWYTTITLAVYGCLTTVEREKAPSPPPPPPPQAQQARSKPQAVLPIGVDIPSVEGDFSLPVTTAPVPPVVGDRSSEWPSPVSSYDLQTQAPNQPRQDSPEQGSYYDSEQGPRTPQDIPLDSQGGAQDPRAMSRSEFPREPGEIAGDGEPRDIPRLESSHDDRARSLSQERDHRGYEQSRDYGRERDRGGDYDRERSWNRDDYRDYRDHGDRGRDLDRVRDSEWDHRARDREQHISDHEPDRHSNHSHDHANPPPARESETVRDRPWPRSPAPERKSPASIRSRSPTMSQGSRDHPQEPEPARPEPDTEPGEIGSPEDVYPPEGQVGEADAEKIYQGLSDGEIQDPDGDGYSEISSDENDLLIEGEPIPQFDWENYEPQEGVDDSWVFNIATYNPYQFGVANLETHADPSFTEYEVEKQRIAFISDEKLAMPTEAQKILDVVATHKNADRHGDWIEAMESLPGLFVPGLVYLVNRKDHKEVLDSLVSWAFEGLELDKALAQPETALKVRHLKMGIKLAASLCQCDGLVAFRMLSKGVQHRLLDLYTSAYMSSAMKLQIIKALDSTTRLKEGVDWLLGRHHLQMASTSEVTAYQRLLKILLDKQTVRSMVALSALVKKIHVCETLTKLSNTVETIVEATEEKKPVPDDETSRDSTMETEQDHRGISVEDAETILTCLEEINKALRNAENTIAQPRRTMPNQVKYSVELRPYDAFPNLFHMFNARGLMESLYVLMCGPATSNHDQIFMAVKDLLMKFTTTTHGLLYLSSKAETVNGILHCLTQNPPPEFNPEETGDEARPQDHPAHQLGLSLIYHLQALQNVDQLLGYHEKSQKCMDDADVLGVLHLLYSMTFTPVTKDVVVQVLSMDDNLKCLLPFFTLTGEEEADNKIKKSVCYSYAIMLLLLVVRHSNNIKYLEKFGSTLRTITEQEHQSTKMSERMAELAEWLLPLQKIPCFDEAHLPVMILCLKQYNDDITDLPKGVVTVMRILYSMAIEPPSNADDCKVKELKYMYCLIELFREDCMPLFYNMIQKLSDVMLRPWQMGFSQGDQHFTVILGAIRPMLAIMKALLSHLISARGADFKDMSSVPCLLALHTVLCSVSTTGVLTPELQVVQNYIVDIFLTFTQPLPKGEETEEALASSLWTICLKEVLNYTLTAPYTFLSGLILLSEMLPLPLPIQSREPLTEDDVVTAVNTRKLWSAHIHPLSDQIHLVITTLAGLCCHPLQQLLRRVCWQLADLAAPTAITLVRCLLDTLLENMNATTEASRPPPRPESGDQTEEPPVPEYPASSHSSRILNLIAFLMNQAPIKAAFLQLTKGGKLDEKYAGLLQRLVNLLNVVSEKAAHTQAQESIVSIFQSLCDLEVTLLTGDTRNMGYTEQIANSLPSSEQVAMICKGLLEHIDHRDHKFSSVLPSLRTLTLLMDHDYGFYNVKTAMEKVSTAFFNLFMSINATFSKDSSDCIATLSSAAECIQFLVSLPEPGDEAEQVIDRSFTMSFREVRELLQWNPDGGHPLDDLNMLLQEYAKEEETLKAVYESVNSVVLILKANDDPKIAKDIVEQTLPPPEPVQTQFGMRLVYLLTEEEDDRLSAPYWLSTPMVDDSDQEIELSTCDLQELASKIFPDYDLKSELQKDSLPSEIGAQSRPKRRKSAMGRRDMINTSRRGNDKGFVAPMRGRGYPRGGGNSGRQDPFRSRPQNTSRPPSMHVDDFVMFETQNQGPTPASSAGANASQPHRGSRVDKESPAPSERGGRGRGGGFDRGRRGGGNNFQGGGGRQFFSPPGNYGGGRRDQGTPRGGYSGSRTAQRGNSSSSMGRGNATSRGNHGPHGNSSKASPWGRSSQRQAYPTSRGFRDGNRGENVERDRRRDSDGGREGRFGGRGGRGGGGGGGGSYFAGSKRDMDSRFMPPPGGGYGGRRNDRGGRHQRAFTK